MPPVYRAAVDAVDNDRVTALAHASAGGQENAMLVLLKCGAAVELKDNHGRTALTAASAKGHARALRVLLEAGFTRLARVTLKGALQLLIDRHG